MLVVFQKMFGRSSASFDRLLEKATSQLLLEPDWTSIMMICDTIRQGDTNPKYAVTAIKKKFYHTNPHVALYALQVRLDTNPDKRMKIDLLRLWRAVSRTAECWFMTRFAPNSSWRSCERW